MNAKIQNSRNILIAVDESENAKRAVLYVRDLLTGLSGFHIKLITIVPEPSEDYFSSESEQTIWINDRNVSATSILEEYGKLLREAGFKDEDITLKVLTKECASIGECILEEQKKLSCGTVVIGRRGISKKEEFIFGSTSSKILHTARDCAVWVIE
jgi:nucleotide-binding universal stress UspA family protein